MSKVIFFGNSAEVLHRLGAEFSGNPTIPEFLDALNIVRDQVVDLAIGVSDPVEPVANPLDIRPEGVPVEPDEFIGEPVAKKTRKKS